MKRIGLHREELLQEVSFVIEVNLVVEVVAVEVFEFFVESLGSLRDGHRNGELTDELLVEELLERFYFGVALDGSVEDAFEFEEDHAVALDEAFLVCGVEHFEVDLRDVPVERLDEVWVLDACLLLRSEVHLLLVLFFRTLLDATLVLLIVTFGWLGEHDAFLLVLES